MPSSFPSIILQGVGSYAPPRVVTNDDLARSVDTSDEWIITRTGIRERRLAEDHQACSDLAVAAARNAIADAGIDVREIDMIIVGTVTPDMAFPSTACLVQKKLGLENIPCFDVEAACTGFLYILEIARSLLRTNLLLRHILIIGSEKLSSIIDWEDRATCVLFGDGAGAAIVSRTEVGEVGVLDVLLGADGSNPELLNVPAGGSGRPASAETVASRSHYLKMNGREVFKFAARVMTQASREILRRQQISVEEIQLIIPHQANIRIIESACKSMRVPIEKFFINLDRYGNTSAASIPIALDEAYRAGQIRQNDLVLLVAFGAGLTWGASLIKWHKSP